MQSTLIRRANYGMMRDGVKGIHPWRQRVGYENFKSQYGPSYKIQGHLYAMTVGRAGRYATLAGTFGAAAGIFALFFFDGIPRVQRDILQKVPFVGGFFVHEIPPEDNPF